MSENTKKRVFVGMSGGVDSSVAAFLLSSGGGSAFGGKNEKYDVTGVYINGFNVDGCSERDAEDARRVADHLGIPFYVIDAREDYFEHVVQYMIKGYKKGLTPNPDVMCNKEIKFGIFLDKALKLGADYIATGHYIRLCEKSQISNLKSQTNSPPKADQPRAEEFHLLEGKDGNKDQSYFLWTLTQEQLRHCLFPVGEYTKPEIREIAKKAKLPTAEKKDSQGICFLGKVKLPEFLKEYIKSKRGDVLDTEGNKIGEHEGAQFYTIGQRHLNIIQKSNLKSQKGITNRKPYYVAEKDVKRNILIAAQGDTHPALFKKEIELTDVHFINTEIKSLIRANRRIDVLVRVRYRQPLFKATLVYDEKKWKVLFHDPQKFVAPGQSAVFYLPAVVSTEAGGTDINESGSHEMLGGGVIL